MFGCADHTFGTTGELKKEVDAGIMEWATLKEAYALLKNSDKFWVDIRDANRFHGGCAVIKTSLFGEEDTCRPCGYDGNEGERTKERHMKNMKCEVFLYHYICDVVSIICCTMRMRCLYFLSF